MLIKCQHCEHENQLGAIFCRNCGEKLDLESNRPETQDNHSVNKTAQIVRRVLSLLALLAVGYMLFAAFVPAGPADMPTLSEEQLKPLQKKFRKMRHVGERVGQTEAFAFTPDEATIILRDVFRNQEGMTPLIVRSAPGGKIAFSATQELFGYMPVRYTILGLPKGADGDGGAKTWDLADLQTRIGRLTLPSFLHSAVSDKFSDVPKAENIQKFLATVDKFEVDADGNFLITVKGVKEKRQE